MPAGAGASWRDAAHRQLLGLLRRPSGRAARARRGRPHRRAHRRLPRRADHAHPVEGSANATRRSATPAPSTARWRRCSAPASTAASRWWPTPAGSTRPAWPSACGAWPPSSASTSPSPTSRATTSSTGCGTLRADGRPARPPRHWPPAVRGGQRPGQRQRLSRGLRHRRGAGGRGRRGGHRDGSPTPRSWSGRPPGASDGPRTDWDRLAGAVAVGHVIECGAQATGGNYAFFAEVPGLEHPGFPIAEMAADGSAVITKHPGTGGLVSVGTVTAQLLYEIGGPLYANPDVVADFSHHPPRAAGPDRVRLSGVRGRPAPEQLKVSINLLGRMAQHHDVRPHRPRHRGEGRPGGAHAVADLLGGDESFADLRRPPDPHRPARRPHQRAGQRPAPGHRQETPTPSGGSALLQRGHRAGAGQLPRLLPDLSARRRHRLRRLLADAGGRATPSTRWSSTHDGRRVAIGSGRPTATPAPGRMRPTRRRGRRATTAAAGRRRARRRHPTGCRSAPSIGARSGDKGGNANVGLWAREPRPASPGCATELTVDRFRDLLPEAADLEVDRYELPNLLALNFVVHGLLGEGVASSTRPDAQAKSLGEYLRSRLVDVPVDAARADDHVRPTRPDALTRRRRPWTFARPKNSRCSARRWTASPSKYGHSYFAERARTGGRTDELWNELAAGGLPRGERPRGVRRGRHGDQPSSPSSSRSWPPTAVPLLLLVVSPAICATIIARFGSDGAEADAGCPRFATGELKMAFAITEPDAGSNSHNIATTATRDGDVYRLQGTKYYISGADESEAVLVVTRTGVDETTRPGPAVALRRRPRQPRPGEDAHPGRDRGPREAVHLVLRRRRGPRRPAVGTEGDGLRQVFVGLNPERIMTAAMANGIGRYALDKAAAYARDRSVWGTPIGRHQGISHPSGQGQDRGRAGPAHVPEGGLGL